MRKFNDIYRVINYEGKKAFLVCWKEADCYSLIKDFGKYVVGHGWLSSSDPIEFIADSFKAINSETSSGIQEIKRVQFRHLPKLVEEFLTQE